MQILQPRSWLLCSSNNTNTGGAGTGGGTSGSGNSKPATGSGRQIRTRARIMRSNTAIRGGSNSGKSSPCLRYYYLTVAISIHLHIDVLKFLFTRITL